MSNQGRLALLERPTYGVLDAGLVLPSEGFEVLDVVRGLGALLFEEALQVEPMRHFGVEHGRLDHSGYSQRLVGDFLFAALARCPAALRVLRLVRQIHLVAFSRCATTNFRHQNTACGTTTDYDRFAANSNMSRESRTLRYRQVNACTAFTHVRKTQVYQLFG